jgi:hypothetical protein
MGDVSVALRGGIRLATAPVAGTWPKTSAVVDMGNTGLGPKQETRVRGHARQRQD